MTKENEITKNANSSIQDSAVKEAFQNGFSTGLKQGRIEGMIAYQKHIIKNLENDNVKMNEQLDELRANQETVS